MKDKTKPIVITAPSVNCDDDKCKLLAYLISWHDETKGALDDKGLQTLVRSKKYKCFNGHITTKSADVKIDLLAEKIKDEQTDSSVKRFHRKGFAGHRKQTRLTEEEKQLVPAWRRILSREWVRPEPLYNPTLTNHARMILRKNYQRQLKDQSNAQS